MSFSVIFLFDFLFSGALSTIMIAFWLKSSKDLPYNVYLDIYGVFIKTYENKLTWAGAFIFLLTLGLIPFQNNFASIFLILSIIFLLGAGIVTRIYMKPLQKQIVRWSKERMPNRWEYVRNSWLNFHIVRTVFILLSFLLIILSI